MNRTSVTYPHFLRSESGAVTVDWVVLTAAAVGLGLATIGVVSNGVESAANETADALASVDTGAPFFSDAELLNLDFSDGLGAFVGGTVANLPGFGEVLQLGPDEETTATLSVPPGAESATVTFDIIGGDDLSGEDATISINGQIVSVYADDHGNVTISDTAPAGISVSVDQHATNSPLGAGSHGHDSRATYTITVDNPGTSLTLGVHSGAGEPTWDEFYALDNVNVVAQ